MGGDDGGRTTDEAGQAPESPDHVPPAPVPAPQVPPAPVAPGFAPLGSVPPGPVPPGPVWQWAPPEEPRGPTVGGLIRGAIRLYRQAFSSLFGLALIQQAIQIVLLIPTMVILTHALNAMMDLFTRTTFPRGGSPNEVAAFQAQFQEQLQQAFAPDRALAVLSALASGIGTLLFLVFLALFTGVALASFDARSDSPSAAMRTVLARPTSFVLPGLILGVGFFILGLPYTVNQSAFSGAGRTPEGARLGLLLTGLGFAVAIVVIYLAVRWSLAIPAMFAEGIGLRAGLRRSSELTQGMRLRIFFAILVVDLVFALVGLIGVVIALLIGVSTGSIAVGVATGVVLFLALQVAVAPIAPAITVVAYRDRVPAQPETTDPQP
jgi:Membrane domain of glycerophosphoryl diester phosphodiesterase